MAYALIFPIVGTDSKNSLRNTLRGIAQRLEGRDQLIVGDPWSYTYLVIAGSNPEIELRIFMGVSADVTETIAVEIAELPPGGLNRTTFGTTLTHAQQVVLLKQKAREGGCSHFWQGIAGTDPATFLVANFQVL